MTRQITFTENTRRALVRRGLPQKCHRCSKPVSLGEKVIAVARDAIKKVYCLPCWEVMEID